MVRRQWESEEPDLIGRIADVIGEERPNVIFTFDPRHGSTCHPDHRAIGSLTVDAAESVSRSVVLLENRFFVSGSSVTIARANVNPSRLLYFDASRATGPGQGSYWEYGPTITGIYRSQFPPEIIQSLAETPRELQWMYFDARTEESGFLGQGMCEDE